MRSRIFIGASAWVLGAATATTGSLYAADQLAHGLLGQNIAQVSVARVNAELAAEGSERASTPSPSPSPSPGHSSPSARPSKTHPGKARPSTAAPSPTDSGTLLTESDGSVMAVCQPGGAYLVYWSANLGFEADDVQRGPTQIARVTFDNGNTGEVVRVTCTGGTPVAHVTTGWNDDGRHHDE